MDRQKPRSTSDSIDLYMRTYYSLLRSTGDVRVRAFEEAHSSSNSSLHPWVREDRVDVAAFAYSAARLPACFAQVRRVVLGQNAQQFVDADLEVGEWEVVRARGRRRAMRWDGDGTLAVFVTSTSDIDDLIPIVTAYQIEWNKMHIRLVDSGEVDAGLGDRLGLDDAGLDTLNAALGAESSEVIQHMATERCDVSIRLLYGSFNHYQRSAQTWWREIEPHYREHNKTRRPVYFVSSNTHSLVNLIGGYANLHRDEIVKFVKTTNHEGLCDSLDSALASGDSGTVSNLLYYLLRAYLRRGGGTKTLRHSVQAYDAESGIRTIESPGKVDVTAQLVELCKIHPERLDERIRVEGLEALRDSDAVIINIDYPLGLSSYHHLTQLAQNVGEIRGAYITGKAATLNGRVGDVMIPSAVYDEHSKNTYLLPLCFSSADVQNTMRHGTVLDNQKAVTVRSAFLQNRDYMSVFYNEGYTIMEMEAGPYMSAIYEIANPKRHPRNEIVHMAAGLPFEVGFLHYASDTPYSRRQSLLSKSMSFFGVESVYGCTIAIVRRILEREVARLSG